MITIPSARAEAVTQLAVSSPAPGGQTASAVDFAAVLSSRDQTTSLADGTPLGSASAVLRSATRFVDGSLLGHRVPAPQVMDGTSSNSQHLLPSDAEQEALDLPMPTPKPKPKPTALTAGAASKPASEECTHAPARSRQQTASRTSQASTVFRDLDRLSNDMPTDLPALGRVARNYSAHRARAERIAAFAPLHVMLLDQEGGQRLVCRVSGCDDDELQSLVGQMIEEADNAGVSITSVTVNGQTRMLSGTT